MDLRLLFLSFAPQTVDKESNIEQQHDNSQNIKWRDVIRQRLEEFIVKMAYNFLDVEFRIADRRSMVSSVGSTDFAEDLIRIHTAMVNVAVDCHSGVSLHAQ